MMKIVAIICKSVLLGFTCLVLVTDGSPQGAGYVVLTLLTLMVPIFSSVVLLRFSKNAVMKIVASLFNIVLPGFACWAFVSQYPHPDEEGFIAFIVILVLTPILNLVALFLSGRAIAGSKE